jgi:hypothetical protein|tara:strand:+ start:509 stop:877 length:369 start_codon:yes stop_codon:yes gene_type:complete
MTKSKSKNQIDKNLFEPTELDFLDGVDVASNIIISKMTPKVANIVRKRLKEGGTTNDKPKPSNVINFPIKPNMPLYEWWKTASVDDVKELLNPVYSEKALEGLSEKELLDLLQYTIDTGGIG